MLLEIKNADDEPFQESTRMSTVHIRFWKEKNKG